MTHRIPMLQAAAVAVLSSIIALSSFAEQSNKRRAVSPGTGEEAILTGTVIDAVTSAPLADVTVRSGARSGRTDAAGQFRIRLTSGHNTSLTFVRVGYETFSTDVNILGNMTATFRLTPRPTVKVRTTAGTTYDLDIETVEFGYIAPFSGYTKDAHLNLCKPGGIPFQPDRADIKTIRPGVAQTDKACCQSGAAVAAIDVELKSGERSTASFVDACFGYRVDVIGQDHKTGDPVYLHFSDIAEITFP